MITEIDLVIAALSAGAAAGLSDTASNAVKEAYSGLLKAAKQRIRRDGSSTNELLISSGEYSAEQRDTLRAALESSELDADLIRKAAELLNLVDPAGVRAGKYTVNVTHTKGVQVGDNNTMNLRF